MRQLTRLLRYLAPYSWQFIPSVILLAGVGFLDAFRVLLIGPILGRVLNPSSGSDNIQLFTIPRTHHTIYLQQFVPSRFHNAWTIVAFAFVASTLVKGLFDYAGTYLVNVQLCTPTFGGIFSEAHHRNSGFHNRQRH
jgi:subfamily B ATP-binding cassette protein MsbA